MTILIIAITSLVSILALSNERLMNYLLLSPYLVIKGKQWHRILTHAFVHADFIHLLVNMVVLFSFGMATEKLFIYLKYNDFISNASVHFFVLYFGGVIISCLPTLNRNKNNYYYQGVGASGAVSAVVFMNIFFRPLDSLYLMGVIRIPAIVFGVLYLIYSHYMSRKASDNINHSAHFAGAVFGFVYPLLINPKLINAFINGFIE